MSKDYKTATDKIKPTVSYMDMSRLDYFTAMAMQALIIDGKSSASAIPARAVQYAEDTLKLLGDIPKSE